MIKNIAAATLMVFFGASCSLDSGNPVQCLVGEGPNVTESSTPGTFNTILHQFPGNLHISSGSFPSISIEGQQNLLDVLNVEIVNEALLLEFNECIESGNFFNVFVSVTELEAVSLEGLGNVIFENDIVANEMELFLTGLGDYEIRGAADSLDITITGQGNVRGFDFITERCDVLIVGNGDVEITANTSLFVTINGQGNVYYKGMPVVFSDINGLGTVNDAN